jgi:hypothetical protein
MKSDNFHLHFLKMVRQTADEVPRVIEAQRRQSDGLGKIGLTDVSVGGCIAFAAALMQGVLTFIPVASQLALSIGCTTSGRRPFWLVV